VLACSSSRGQTRAREQRHGRILHDQRVDAGGAARAQHALDASSSGSNTSVFSVR
jgi:hypothetical protein